MDDKEHYVYTAEAINAWKQRVDQRFWDIYKALAWQLVADVCLVVIVVALILR